MKVAAELVTKDPIALRCVKEAYRYSLEMPWEAAMGLSSAKESEVAICKTMPGRNPASVTS